MIVAPGIDISRYQDTTPPLEGLAYVILRASIGTLIDARLRLHQADVAKAGLPTAYYHALLDHDDYTTYSGAQQAHAFSNVVSDVPDAPLNIDGVIVPRFWVDVEAAGITAAKLSDFLAAWKLLRPRAPIGIYTSQNAWYATIGRGHHEFTGYALWDADYSGPLDLADIWTGALIRQTTGTGHIQGYNGYVDLDELQVPALPVKAMVPNGSLIGIHSIWPGNTLPMVKQAVLDGIPYPVVVILNDAGVCMDIKVASPTTKTVCRYYNPADDSLQGVGDWTPSERQAWAGRCLRHILSNANDAQIAATDWFLIENEPDPNDPNGGRSYPTGYRAMALCYMELINQAETENNTRRAAGRPTIKLGLGCLAQGTPEFDEMQAMFETGLFQLMAKLGYLWVVHEGVFTNQDITFGFGDDPVPGAGSIPGAPHDPNAGSTCFRHNYLYDFFLRPNGIFVPLLIGEWYGGGQYSDLPEEQLKRFAWYDGRFSVEPEAIGFCGYTCNPDQNWKNADYTKTLVSQAMRDYRLGQANRKNGASIMPAELSDTEVANFLAATAQLSAIANRLQPPAAKHTLVGKTDQDVINLFHKAAGDAVYIDWITLAGLSSLYTPNSDRPLPYAGPAIEDMPNLTQAEKDALIAAL